jgi:hypothetical protein
MPMHVFMTMFLLRIHVHAATCIWTFSMEIALQQRHDHAAWTWIGSRYWVMQQGHGHSAWPWICSLDGDMEKQHVLAHDDVHVHAACHVYAACPCPCCMSKSLLHIQVHTACQYPCCMDLNMWHWHWHAVWKRTYSTDMGIYSIAMDTQHRHEHAAWTWTRSIGRDMHHGLELGHAASTCPCPYCSMSILFHVRAACQFLASCSCPFCMSTSMLYLHHMYMLHVRVHAERGHGH